jgi:hypothetical protein
VVAEVVGDAANLDPRPLRDMQGANSLTKIEMMSYKMERIKKHMTWSAKRLV